MSAVHQGVVSGQVVGICDTSIRPSDWERELNRPGFKLYGAPG